MIRCLIIDDEPLACDLIKDHIEKDSELECVQIFHNPIEALNYLDHHTIDLIFLDIQMPEISGIQFAKIANGKYPVIFTTAYDEYAIQGYQLDVIDYLLKPIDLDRFQQAVERFKRRISTQLSLDATDHHDDAIFVKSEYKTIRIEFDNILFIESMSDYVMIHTKSEKVMTLDTIKNLLTTLPSRNFIRVHKSFIIALNKIDFIERQEIEINNVKIPIGETYKAEFLKRIRS